MTRSWPLEQQVVGGCPKRQISQVLLRHEGSDNWGGPYVKLLINGSSAQVQCDNDGGKIELHDNAIDLTCTLEP